MKLVFLLVIIAVAVTAVPVEYKDAVILNSSYDGNPDGAYNFEFETDDGTKRKEEGQLKQVLDEENKPQHVLVVRGTISYVDPEGNNHNFNYSADENGYVVQVPQNNFPIASH